MIPAIDAPRFEAQLGSATGACGTLFVSGSLNGYEIEGLRTRAMYGVESLHIRLIGANLEQARRELEGQLAPLSRRGVRISFNHD
jgi:hypothetical protein